MQRVVLCLMLLIVPALATWAAHRGVAPGIDGYGEVQPFPNAAEQPRPDSRIVVDITQGGPKDKINPAIEKLARFVNIYAKAGKTPTKVQIAVVLHGDATQVALSDEVYGQKFGVPTNPNLPVVRILRQHQVELLVCGQALTRKGFDPATVGPEISVAVSGLTALVNKQQDGYAYIPLLQ